MRITFYINAMMLLESQATRILCDPWVTFDNVSSSGFYNFPKCNMSPEEVAAINPDFIYITHTHPDHFDPTTLALFDRSTPVLVAPYAKNFTERELHDEGFHDVRIVPLQDGLSLNGDDHVWIEPAAVYSEVDSIAVFRLDGETVVNANDNVFNEAQCVHLRELAGGIDIALLPSGAHGPWPMFFENLSVAEKTSEAAKRFEAQTRNVSNYVRAFQPEYVVPIAGGIICGGDKARQYAYSGIRPRSTVVGEAARDVEFKPVMLSELCVFDSATGLVDGKYEEKTHATEGKYLDELAMSPGLFGPRGKFHIAASERKDLSRLLGVARGNQKKWQDRLGVTSNSRYYFDVGDDHLYGLSFVDDNVRRVRREDLSAEESYELYRMPYELLVGLLTRHYIWSNVNTQHMWFYRNRVNFDHNVEQLMNYLAV